MFSMAGQFEIYRDGLSYRFRLTGDNGEVLAVSAAYPEKKTAAAAIMAVRENAASGHVVDKSAEPLRVSERPLAAHRATRRRGNVAAFRHA
jgi:uncharacterized protein YegP (UPF0339 family)